MSKLLKLLFVGIGLISLTTNVNALEIQQNEIGSKTLLVCTAGYVNTTKGENCLKGFNPIPVEEYAKLKGYQLESYELQISQGLVYIVMKVSK